MSEPIRITAQVVGAVQVETRLLYASSRVREFVGQEIERLSTRLQRKVKEEKLSGQVLKRRTGRLSRSINKRIVRGPDYIEGRVGTNVGYGKDWELGFHLPARDIYPVKAQALFWPGASHPVAHVHQAARDVAARPFLRPSLEEMRPEIQFRLARAAFLGVA